MLGRLSVLSGKRKEGFDESSESKRLKVNTFLMN